MKAFDKFCKILEKIASVITVALMIFLTVLIAYSVLSRFIFNKPVAWQYELTLVCFSWIIFIGMSITFALDEHMRLTFVPGALKGSTQNIWLMVMDAIVVFFLLYSAWSCVGQIQTAMKTMYQTIPVARGWFYMPYPIGALMSVCQIVNVNYKRMTGQMHLKTDADA